jgi:hypothetical protein
MLFHFTSGDRCSGIARDGIAPLGVVSLDGRSLYARCLWLTDEPNPQCQPWAHIDGGRDKLAVRLAVEPARAVRWFDYAREHRATPAWVAATIAFGSEHWWLTDETLQPVEVHVRGGTRTGQLVG